MSLSRSPFLSPADRRQEAQAARAPFFAEKSDHLALLRAYEAWEREATYMGHGPARRFAEAHFLSHSGMEELHGLRRQLAGTLAEIGFAPASALREAVQRASEERLSGGGDRQTNLVRALLCAGLYPNLVRVRMPDTTYEKTAHGAVESVNEDARAVKFYLLGRSELERGAGGGNRVFLHPSCALFAESAFTGRWMVYTSKQQVGGGASAAGGEKTYVRDVSAVSPLALLLFGGDVQVHHDKGTVTIDGQIEFESAGRTAVLVRELRAELDKLLHEKIRSPGLQIGEHPVLEAIVGLLAHEKAGFS